MGETGAFGGLDRIGQIAVRVRDLDRAVPFYRDVLGIPFLFRAGELALFQCGGVSLLLGGAESEASDHPSSVIYFLVEDVDVAYRALRERGVAFLGEPHVVHRAADHELWMAFFRDLEDNVFALMERRR